MTIIYEKEHIENLVESIRKLAKDRTVIVTNQFDGTVSSPSKRKKFYRIANPVLAPDVFKGDGIEPILHSKLIMLVFARPEEVDTS